jgi:hypothetical protein
VATPYKHKRSAIVGAAPQTLLEGELALRYAAADPALLFQNSNGVITHILARIDGGEIIALDAITTETGDVITTEAGEPILF